MFLHIYFTRKVIPELIDLRRDLTKVVGAIVGIHRHSTRGHSWLNRVPIDPSGNLVTPKFYKLDSKDDLILELK